METSTSNFYLRMSTSVYSNGGYTYAALINGQWYAASYKGTQSSGGQGGPGGGGHGGSLHGGAGRPHFPHPHFPGAEAGRRLRLGERHGYG